MKMQQMIRLREGLNRLMRIGGALLFELLNPWQKLETAVGF